MRRGAIESGAAGRNPAPDGRPLAPLRRPENVFLQKRPGRPCTALQRAQHQSAGATPGVLRRIGPADAIAAVDKCPGARRRQTSPDGPRRGNKAVRIALAAVSLFPPHRALPIAGTSNPLSRAPRRAAMPPAAPAVLLGVAETARALLSSKALFADLDDILHAYYATYIIHALASAPEPPNSTLLALRKRKNSVTSTACAHKKGFGVAVMTEMAAALLTDLPRHVAAAEAYARPHRTALAAAAAAAVRAAKDGSSDAIRTRVEEAAEAARREKVFQKSSSSALDTAVVGVRKGRRGSGVRRAQNCATAHKHNRVKKGLFDQYRVVVERLGAARSALIAELAAAQREDREAWEAADEAAAREAEGLLCGALEDPLFCGGGVAPLLVEYASDVSGEVAFAAAAC